MSDSGESGTMSDTGDSRPMSDTGESSVFSDWSMVDKHGELPDDDTTSTTSSVEVVEDDNDDTNIDPVTPVAGSPSGVAPRFILRLPSHKQDASDTDEDQTESVTHPGVSQELNTVSPAGVKAGQTYRQSSSEARVSQEQLEELRKTLDTLKKNLQPSRGDDSSISSIELFGSGKPDKDFLKKESGLLPQRQVENIGIHGNMLDGNLSLESSVSSSYSFLSRDAGTECSLLGDKSGSRQNSLGDQPDQDGVTEISNPEDMQATNEEGNTQEKQTEQGTSSPECQAGRESTLEMFVHYPLKYIFLVGLTVYIGVVIVTVLCIHRQGPDFAREGGALSRCQIDNQMLQLKLDRCDNHLLEGNAIADKKDEKIKMLLGENDKVSAKLIDREREIIKLEEKLNILVEENEKIKTTDQELQRKQAEVLDENERLLNLFDQTQTQCADWKSHLEKCQADNLDVEDVRRLAEKDLTAVQRKCQSDLDNLKSQYQFEIDGVSNQYQSNLDKVRKQYQSDLDRLRNNYQSDLDSLKMHTEAHEKYTKAQCTAGRKQGHGYCDTVSEHEKEDAQSENNEEADETQSVHKKRTEKSQKEEQTRQNDNFQSTRNEKSSSHTKQSDKQSGNNKGDNSDKFTGESDEPGSYWADTVLHIMNKTREQIQDTWAKVKNMSESLWEEHQPTLSRLHDSFTRRFKHLSKKFQDKLTKKINKWFRKSKRQSRKEKNGPQANTKRRQYNSDGDVSNSNRTVEERLVKLSHQVQALNAKKFKKWKEFPKVLDIQREFEQVNIVINTDDQQQMQKNKLTDGYLEWLRCQFRWWKDVDVVTVTDDCYLSLCCWQVKVTGGDVKQCKRVKRKQGIVEDSCALEPVNQMYTSQSNNQNRRTSPGKNKFRKSDHVHQGPSSTPNNNEEIMDQKPASNDEKEENWFLERGKEREYDREEPDNWFFRRKNNKVLQNEKTGKDYFDDDDDDVNDDYYDEDCDYDWHTGYCIYP
ncbi:putative leucine-rich repeat-containing protein DDB_G0290503 [Mercenaria mercenaria]|uniref:putative leucine-rich repeat-containing protein DDB_G0290503 n=1 Tax=Mercenaria mercenaria TaxID=6596 RepID=UPI00234F9935|nr:putative leucine-rich repeat-containing protein DDB_G0290503 [Mercenaria mercenaria]